MKLRPPFLHLVGLAALLVVAHAAAAPVNQDCSPSVLGPLGRALAVAHFLPAGVDPGQDRAGVVRAASCKRLPDDPTLTLAAVGWDTAKPDTKGLVVALVDVAAGTVPALQREEFDEDASTVLSSGSLRLDTAPYLLAPGVRAFGVDFSGEPQGCGEGIVGPQRTLYVRDGRALRPVLRELAVGAGRYLRGNEPRCASDPHAAATAIFETYDVTIALGAPGNSGWRDLLLTVTAHRDDHQPSRLKPLHVRVPYDGQGYPLGDYEEAYRRWRQ